LGVSLLKPNGCALAPGRNGELGRRSENEQQRADDEES